MNTSIYMFESILKYEKEEITTGYESVLAKKVKDKREFYYE